MQEYRAKRFKPTITVSDQNLKKTVLADIHRAATILIIDLSNEISFDFTDIGLMNQIGLATYSMINYYQKKCNDSAHLVSAELKITIKKDDTRFVASRKVLDLVASLERQKILRHGDSDETKKKYFEIMKPILELLTFFPLRFKEVILGASYFFQSSTQKKRMPISIIGLSTRYAALLEGITYPPARKFSLLQSLGACTIAYSLIKEKNPTYKKKYSDALMSNINHLPIANSLVEYFAIHGEATSLTILRVMADVLLLTGNRRSHTLAIPFGVFYHKFHSVSWTKTADTYVLSSIHGTINEPIDINGKGRYTLIKHFQTNKWKMNWSGEQFYLKQVVFHAIMGTGSLSFEVLKNITDNNTWHTHQTMIDCFKNRAVGNLVEFEPIKLNYVSKMLSTANNILLKLGTGVMSCSEPFSGRYVRVYTRDELDFALQRSLTSFASAPNTILEALGSIKSYLIAKIAEGSTKIAHTTTEWQRIEDYVSDQEFVVQLTLENSGPCFYTTNNAF